jgi:carboxylesterase
VAHPILAGAEPFSARGGPNGVLVLHGFTGNPHSLRGLAQAFARAGLAVELPLLPGHGTDLEDMIPTRWSDWSAAAQAAYAELAGRCRAVVVAGLSMGGTLATWLAAGHPEIAGLIAINPLIDPPAAPARELMRGVLASGTPIAPGVGSDIADPDSTELAYQGSPIEAALSMFDALDELVPRLGDIRCPVLLFTSPQDHVVPPGSSDVLERCVSGPVQRVTLERSYHVATLDYDAAEIEERSVEWVAKLLADR